MLTLFSIPKAFRGHIGTIQTNAIESWTLLGANCEIILFGEEEGTAGMAGRLRLRHVPEVEGNEYGTPLLNYVFDKAQRMASFRLLCYVNADIILMGDLITAVRRIRMQRFLMAGRKWRIDVAERINFDDENWETLLRTRMLGNGILDRPDAIDYFVFPRGLYEEVPAFAVGRTAWDNWLIYGARSLGVPVIDASEMVMVIHQNHDYSNHPKGREGIFEGREAKRNLELAGGVSCAFSLKDATWILSSDGLWPALSYTHLRRRRDTLPLLFPEGGLAVKGRALLLSVGLKLHVWLRRLHGHRLGLAAIRRAMRFFSSHSRRSIREIR